MSGVVETLGTWFALISVVYLGFLAFGVNLLPAWLGSRAGLAVAGAVILVGGTRMI